MSDVVGRGTIELVGDARKLKASIEDAKKSIRTLGEGQKDVSKSAQQSIDKYIGRLQAQNAMLGKSTRETELFKLAMRGASDEQLRTADAALKFAEAQKRQAAISSTVRAGLFAAAAAGTAAAAGLAAMISRSIDLQDRLNDLNKTTGISVEQLSGLQLAAKQSGGDLESIAASINKLSQNIGKDGEKFRALGITAKDPLEAFKQLSDIFVSIQDPQQRAALGAAALGKSWQGAAPLLAEGGKAIQEMVDKGTKLSGITTQNALDADKFNDTVAELSASFGGLSARLTNAIIPQLQSIASVMRDAALNGDSLIKVLAKAGDVAINGSQAYRDAKAFNEALAQKLNLEERIAKIESGADKSLSARSPATLTRLKAELSSTVSAMQELQAAQDARDRAAGGSESKPNGAGDPNAAARVNNFLKEQKAVGDADSVYRGLMKTLQEKLQIDKESSEVQKLLLDLDNLSAEAYEKLTIAQLANLEATANDVDLKKEQLTLQERDFKAAIARLEAQEMAAETAAAEDKSLSDLAQRYKDLIDPLASYRRELEEIEKLRRLGYLSDDAARAAQGELESKLIATGEAAKEASDAGRDFGLIMKSAFEKAVIEGDNLRDVLKGLLKDIAQMGLRKTVTEPLGNFIGDLFKGGGSGSGGSFAAGGGDIFDTIKKIWDGLPSFDVGISRVPRDMVAKIHRDEEIVPAGRARSSDRAPMVNNYTFNFNTQEATSRAAQGQIQRDIVNAIAKAQRYA